MKKKVRYTYTIRFNRFKRTYTIRKYLGKKLVAKYRSYPQGRNFDDRIWIQEYIESFLLFSNDYYRIY